MRLAHRASVDYIFVLAVIGGAACGDADGGQQGDAGDVLGGDIIADAGAQDGDVASADLDTAPADAAVASDVAGDTGSPAGACVSADDCGHLAPDGKLGPCLKPACLNQVCRILPAFQGEPCDDDDACTLQGACNAGVCEAGGTLTCADADPCTADTCDPVAGCQFVVTDGLVCDDGNACTESDHCEGGRCGGTPRTCDDGNPCTTGACVPGTGLCESVPAPGAPCDDGDACTDADLCQGDGTCGGATLDCSGADPCAHFWCDHSAGCRTAPRCDDQDPCTTDSCNPDTLACTYTPVAEGVACDDGYACTTDDACLSGACVGSALPCPDEQVCAEGACREGFIEIPAGSFWMGCNATVDTQCYVDENPLHEVTLGAYEIQRLEVTQGEFDVCVAAGKCTDNINAAGNPCSADPLKPASCVTWYQAKAYCEQMVAGGRLPTSAEWEKAARGGCELYPGEDCALAMPKYPWGNAQFTCEHAVAIPSMCGHNRPQRVGSRPLGNSPYGLYDMAGNVSEWVMDWYALDYYATSPATDPPGAASGTQKVLRGGQYNAFESYFMRTSLQVKGAPSGGGPAPGLGFRCVRPLP